MIVKDIEESNGSMELLLRQEIPVSLRAHKNRFSHKKPPGLRRYLPSLSQPSSQTTVQVRHSIIDYYKF